jgi:glycosyltransferase involved in cell wall biosynthesis
MSSPKVTVSVTTFNHAPFVRQALDGVLGQKTPFDVEVLIGEDDSSDGTREIVREYEARYPTRIRAFYHDAASKLRIGGRLTGRNNLAHNLSRARGEYIALLDGDDFWTDPTKLTRQVEQLEKDPTLMTSFHAVDFVDEKGEILQQPESPGGSAPRCTLNDLISGNRVAQTGSVLFRRGAIHPLPAWYFETAVGDFPLHVMNGHRGDFGYIDRCMAAYRLHQGGIWSGGGVKVGRKVRSAEEIKAALQRNDMLQDLMAAVAKHSAARFRPAARRRLSFFAYDSAILAGKLGDKAALRKQLGLMLRNLPWPENVRWRIMLRLARHAI